MNSYSERIVLVGLDGCPFSIQLEAANLTRQEHVHMHIATR